MNSETFHNIVNREALTSDDRWQQLMMHEGTAYIVRAEKDGTWCVWRSIPPQTFSYLTTTETQDEALRATYEDFESKYTDKETA